MGDLGMKDTGRAGRPQTPFGRHPRHGRKMNLAVRRMLLAAAFLFPPGLHAQEEPLGVVVSQAVTAPGRIDARRASRGLGEGGVLDILAIATFAAALILSARFFTGAGKPPPIPGQPDARGAPLGRRGRRDAKGFGEQDYLAGVADAGKRGEIAASCHRSGKAGEFIARNPERSPEFYDAYARAFLMLGDADTARRLLELKKPSDSRDAELCSALAKAHGGRRPSKLPAVQAYVDNLALAVELSSHSFHHEAVSLLSDELLAAAAVDSYETVQVVSVLRAAGRLDELLKPRRGRGGAFHRAYAAALRSLKDPGAALALLEARPLEPEDCALYVECRKESGSADRLADARVPEGSKADFAQALIDAGQDRAALKVLTEGRQAGLGRRDYALALRACQRLGEFAAATRIFDELQDSMALMEAPELYYLHALLCEKAGRLQPAREIYEKLAKRISDYKDVAARLRNLDSVSERDITRLTAALAEPSAAPATGRPAPQVVAGQFELREPLGVGGMGMVFKGWDRSLSRPVAVKQMRETIARDAGAREQFLREARLVAALNHPYIVSIHAIATEGADIFLVFEFVDGENLQQIVASRGRIAPRNCVNILHHVCDALAYAHQNGVIHRDLKPANIMHDNKSGHVKVMDFGIAAPAADGGRPPYCGTPAYMAPEQHAGAACPQSDVFSLGATLYEMLTGELPFKGGRDDIQRRKEAMDYAPPSAVAPGLPEAWDKVVAKCLAPDKRHRYESVKSFMRAAAQAPDHA
ncbi:MAG: serine/threonine protein kinase [Elusimicrobia bacterium]|nr:serine/threonine protein kinase [Elusimicrobiota bacterium]